MKLLLTALFTMGLFLGATATHAITDCNNPEMKRDYQADCKADGDTNANMNNVKSLQKCIERHVRECERFGMS